MEKIFHAIEFATQAHRYQFRKGTTIPYIVHPLAVMKILLENQCNEQIAIAGILHDTVEDTTVTHSELVDKFGAHIAEIVKSVSEPDKTASWEIRKQHTIEQLKTASEETLLVFCADKIDNMKSMIAEIKFFGDTFWNRFNRPREKQQWYYQAVATELQTHHQYERRHSLVPEFLELVHKIFP